MAKIKINETKLKEMIKNIVSENVNNNYKNMAFDILNELKDMLGSEQLCDRLVDRLAGQIDWKGVVETLQDIYEIECSPYCEDDEE